MSDYGAHLETAVPYTLALLGLAAFSRTRRLVVSWKMIAPRNACAGCCTATAPLCSSCWSALTCNLNIALRDFTLGSARVLILFEVASSVWMFLLFRRFVWVASFWGCR